MSSEQGIYRRLSMRMWGDEKFRRLSPLQPSGQALWMNLLTGMHTGPIPGVFTIGRAAMAEALNWEIEDFQRCLDELIEAGMVEYDHPSRLWFIPNAVKHNPPASPNVVTGWRNAWTLLPEGHMRDRIAESIARHLAAMSEGFQKAFREATGKPSAKPLSKPSVKASPRPSPNQEQEQDSARQDQDQDPDDFDGDVSPGHVGAGAPPPSMDDDDPPGIGTTSDQRPQGAPTDAAIALAAQSADLTTKKQRGQRLPAAWVLPKAWGEWALSAFPRWTPDTVRDQADQFADYWRAKPGKDGAKVDWLATWRYWCRNATRPKHLRPMDAANSSADSVANVARLLGYDPNNLGDVA